MLHSFYQLDDGSYLAFFEAPDRPFEFKEQHDFDLHIALEVEPDVLDSDVRARASGRGLEMRGISDHEMIDSIYFRDPNGYVIELTAKGPTTSGDGPEEEPRPRDPERLAEQQERTGSGLTPFRRYAPPSPADGRAVRGKFKHIGKPADPGESRGAAVEGFVRFGLVNLGQMHCPANRQAPTSSAKRMAGIMTAVEPGGDAQQEIGDHGGEQLQADGVWGCGRESSGS